MTDEISPSDRLFFTIHELNGWYQVLEVSRDEFYGANATRYLIGRLLNTIILSAGEDVEPIAIGGELDDDGTGELTLVYTHLILRVSATRLRDRDGTFDVRIWPLTAATNLKIDPRRSYFEGTETHPRYEGVRITFALGDDEVLLVGKRSFGGTWPALQDDSIYAAFMAIRDAK